MFDVWIIGSDQERAGHAMTTVSSLGFTPRRITSLTGGRPESADGGALRRPDVMMAIADRDDPLCRAVCELLDLHNGADAPIVLAVEEMHLAELPHGLSEHELIVHPYSPGQLRARIRRARMQHSGIGSDNTVRAGTVELNLSTYSVSVDDLPIAVSNLEYELLKFLLTHPQRVLTREALLSGVWGYDYYGGARTVDVHIRRLRAKLGPDADRIKTVRGVGYRFDITDAQAVAAC